MANENRIKRIEKQIEAVEKQGSYEESILGYVDYFTYQKWCDLVDRLQAAKLENN